MTIALELQQLKKTYPGGVQALRGIDLQVEAGDFYALLGPNGAGKSTTIGIISSLVNKTSGRVSVFGYDLEKDVVNAKRQLGLVPQEFNFNPFETVQQIVVNQAGYYGVERKDTVSRESAPRSLVKLASVVTSDPSTPNLSTIIAFTLDAISDITLSF